MFDKLNNTFSFLFFPYNKKDKSKLSEDHLSGLVEIVEDESIAKGILRAAKISMGMDTSEQGSPPNNN